MGLLCMCLTTKMVQITSDSDLWKLCIDIDHVFITIYIVMDFLLSSPKWKCEKLPGKTGPEPEKGFFLYSSSSHTVTGKTIWKGPPLSHQSTEYLYENPGNYQVFGPLVRKGQNSPFQNRGLPWPIWSSIWPIWPKPVLTQQKHWSNRRSSTVSCVSKCTPGSQCGSLQSQSLWHGLINLSRLIMLMTLVLICSWISFIMCRCLRSFSQLQSVSFY